MCFNEDMHRAVRNLHHYRHRQAKEMYLLMDSVPEKIYYFYDWENGKLFVVPPFESQIEKLPKTEGVIPALREACRELNILIKPEDIFFTKQAQLSLPV